jgi:hypothetical protein
MTAATGSDPLAGLRGYHLPEPVSWWPPAAGWWVLAGLMILLTVLLTWVVVRRRRRHMALRTALAELDTLIGARAEVKPVEFTRHLSRLLRRYALVRFPRHEVAGLTGDDWLRFLDTHGGTVAVLDELAILVRAWILHNAETASP